jgi:hypothetical protein
LKGDKARVCSYLLLARHSEVLHAPCSWDNSNTSSSLRVLVLCRLSDILFPDQQHCRHRCLRFRWTVRSSVLRADRHSLHRSRLPIPHPNAQHLVVSRHSSFSSTAFCLLWLLRQAHSCLAPLNPGVVTSCRQRQLVRWTQFLENVVEERARRLKDGFRGSIIQGALNASMDVDLRALGWLFKLPALANTGRGKVQDLWNISTPCYEVVPQAQLGSMRVCADSASWYVYRLSTTSPKLPSFLMVFRLLETCWVTRGPTSQISVLCEHCGLTETLLSASLLVPFAHCLPSTYASALSSSRS